MRYINSTLPSGQYVICDPSKFLEPRDYRKLLRGISVDFSDSGEHKFAWVDTGRGIFWDIYGNEYVTDQFLCCVPIEMLTHIDISFLEPFYFKENFKFEINGSVVKFGHVQIVLR